MPTQSLAKQGVAFLRRPPRRHGSVLLLVIVLLLLLTILGTAYISTSRNDRITSAQNLLNTQTDVTADGLAKTVASLIMDDLNDQNGPLPFGNLRGVNATAALGNRSVYRGIWIPTQTYNYGDVVDFEGNPPVTGTPPIFYYCSSTTGTTAIPPANGWTQTTHIDVTSSFAQPWLADRIPSIPTVTPPTAAGVGNWPYWLNISHSVNAGAIQPILPLPNVSFESPDGSTMLTAFTPLYPAYGTLNNVTVPILTSVAPTSLAPPVLPVANTVIAADADGDGIADSLLFRIPGDFNDGLTWYAAVRIVDNNAAINANTAWSRDQDYAYPGGAALPNWGFFPTGVGLLEMLNNATTNTKDVVAPGGVPNIWSPFNAYRFNDAGPLAHQAPLDETSIIPGNPPVDRSAPPGGDFQYISEGDAFYHQFITRMGNPGYNTFAAAPGLRYQALPLSDTAALAYHFCLVNANSGQSLLESLLPNSLYYQQTTPTNVMYRFTPYNGTTGNDVVQWWNDNFYYDVAAPTYMPIRPLLVTRNPVSNYINPVYDPSNAGEPIITAAAVSPNTAAMLPYGNAGNTTHIRGQWVAAQAYNVSDIVAYAPANAANGGIPTPTAPDYTFMCLAAQPIGSGPPATVAGGVMTANGGWQLQPWSSHPTKANVNTATFAELFRAFWCVMAGNPANSTPFGTNPPTFAALQATIDSPYATSIAGATYTPWHQFRTVLRDPTVTVAGPPPVTPNTVMDPTNVMLLRAAIAAVNTLGLRDESQNVISRTVSLNAYLPPAGGGTPVQTPVEARVYSSAPQPYISEVYVNTNNAASPADTNYTSANPNGYVAIELYNPTNAPMTLTNWQLALVQRTAAAYPNLQFTMPAVGTININSTIANAPSIPAGGYAILENYDAANPATGNARYRPANSGLLNGVLPNTPANPGPGYSVVDVYVPNLYQVITNGAATGGELVLLRPRRADGTYTASIDPQNTFNEGNPGAPNLADLVPVDSYDFTGIVQEAAEPFHAYSYVRAKGAGEAFKAVYPNLYTLFSPPGNPATRQSGTDVAPVTAALPNPGFASNPNAPPPWVPTDSTPKFGAPSIGGYINLFAPIQVYNVGLAGTHTPNAVVTPAGNTANPQHFPFGTFARNGDMLDIPFIGAYRIQINGGAANQVGTANFLELNSLPMDCSFADDGDSNDDTVENIGRFCPLYARPSAVLLPPAPAYPDYYGWARNLFNYLTVQSNNDAYMPNFDPGLNDVSNTPKYWPTPGASPPYSYPTPVYAKDGTAQDQTTQDNVGVDGLININTASWKVLSMLPMVTYHETGETVASHPNASAANEALAKAIVLWRDGDTTGAHPAHGPFMSIFDLNQITDGAGHGFQNAWGYLAGIPTPNGTGAAGIVTTNNGLLTPPDNLSAPTGLSTGVTEDYQADFAVLNRISNLITTRSDTFTVYIVLEGWQNAGTATAQLKTTRRFAFIADRSGVNADTNTRFIKTVVFPND